MNVQESVIAQFNSLSDIEKYQHLVKLRDLLKGVQQLSWNINNFDKKFSVENSFGDDYVDLLKAYMNFAGEIETLAHLFREIIY